MKDQLLSTLEFESLMAPFAPFERAPVIAVGVSGGPDSMAVVCLVDRWARARGGRAIGLTVDHGLRPESSDEAAQVGRWLDRLGIEHHALEWIGEKPKSAVQEVARQKRRDLLLSWCRDAGVVHLVLAHHAEDQAETYLMRLAHGSGPEGLAGMAPVIESHCARIIRPVLSMPKNRLVALLVSMDHPWICDPSNDQGAFERIRVRKALAAMAETGAGQAEIMRAVNDYAVQRRELDAITSDMVMRSVTFHAAGYACIDVQGLSACGNVLGTRAMSRVLWAVGGRAYPPAREPTARLYHQLTTECANPAVTLGGCRLIPGTGQYLVCREQRNLPAELSITHGGQFTWDNRFLVNLVPEADQAAVGDITLRPLGKDGWRKLVASTPDIRPCPVPESARYSLPALYHNDAIVQVAHLTEPDPKAHSCSVRIAQAQFMPPEPVVGAGFPLA